MTEITDFEKELHQRTGLTYDIIRNFEKTNKSNDLAKHVAWHVAGGVVSDIDKMKDFVKEVESKFGETSSSSQDGDSTDNKDSQNSTAELKD